MAATARARRLVGQRVVDLPDDIRERIARIAPVEREPLARRLTDTVLSQELSAPLGSPAVDLAVSTPAPLLRADGASVYTTHGAQLYTSPRILAAERRILAASGRYDGMRATDTDVQLAMLEWSANNGGQVLNHGQAGAVAEMATSGARVALTLAPAGTGKTTMMGALAAACSNAGMVPIGVAPQAAAAEELSRALGGAPTDTLDKLVWEITHPSPWTPAWVCDIGPPTLLIIDEAGLASTRNLDIAIDYVLHAGGSVRLIGDDQQLAAAAAGGVLRDIAAAHGALTLSEVVRFTDRTEGLASLALRARDQSAVGFYLDRRRIHAGDVDTVVEQVYAAWSSDRAAGGDALMLAPTLDMVARLNARARADRLAAVGRDPGREVIAGGREVVSAGDIIITKQNDRALSLGGTDFVKNGQRWHVDEVHSDGTLAVTALERRKQIRLPSWYVAEHVRLGYASTLRGSQGVTVGRPGVLAGVCHAIITPDLARADLYLALTRGTDGNHAHVVVTGAGEEHSIVRPEAVHPATAAEILATIIARDSQTRSATTEQRDAADPAPRLGIAAVAYRDALASGAAHLLGAQRLEALTAAADRAVPGVTAAPAWETLRAHLALLTLTGNDWIAALSTAAISRELHTARDVATVLDWRLDPSGNHSQGAGPLPWLPAVPAVLAATPQWGKFLNALAERVSHLAAQVQASAAAWDPGIAPTWAQPYLEHCDLAGELAVWRAATRTVPDDPRPAGGAQQAIAMQRHRDQLIRRVLTAVGPGDDAADRWRAAADAIDERITADDYWPVVAARLNTADAVGLPVPALIHAAAEAGPLPDEQPAAVLWWRLARHLSAVGGDLPTGTHHARPPWSSQLYAALGDTIAERIIADRLWPAIVARFDTATRDGHDPARLARDAAGMLAAHTGELNPTELAPSLLWIISTLADPEPIDPAFEPLLPDAQPPPDLDDLPAAVPLAAVATGDTITTAADEPPHDPEYDPAPPDPADAAQPEARTGPVQIDVDTPDDEALFALQLRGATSTPRERLLELNSQALEFFRAHYRDAWAPGYVTQRLGTDLADDERFQPGYAPAGWTALTDHLGSLGATDAEVVDAGLGSYARTGRVIDRFRDRLVAPIYHHGELRGFVGRRNGARRDDDRAGPKYLNTAETDLYSKGEQLYGYDQNRDALSAGATPAVVEGLLDAWAITVATDASVVGLATLGTAFTDRHADQLRAHRGTGTIVAFDPDPAGLRAAEAAYWKLTARGAAPVQLALPDGIDPAQFFETEGPAALAAALQDDLVPMARILIDQRVAAFADRLHEAEARVFAARRAAEVIAALPPNQWAELADYVAEATSTSLPVMQLEIVTASETLHPVIAPVPRRRYAPRYARPDQAAALAARAAQLDHRRKVTAPPASTRPPTPEPPHRGYGPRP